MLVNYLFNIRLDYHNNIEVYNLMMTFVLAVYSTFITSSCTDWCSIKTFCSFFYLYLLVDTLFIPNDRLDRYLHHFLSYVLVTFAKRKEYDTSIVHELLTIPFIQTEVSTIFLTTSILLKRCMPTQELLLNVSNAMLFYTFLQYRILNLTYVVYHLFFHYESYFEEKNDLYLIRCVSTLLLLLNYVWEYKICVFFYRHYKVKCLLNRFNNTIRKSKLIASKMWN